ncbi:MAG TPA: helix-turn-helix transcriptional regulator [Solirubrobacteraceae bacterium]|jgi:transcriptional regulator with XRE-family HTH domain|nr:helix-turn-helix transcriptional regulator [Solirubrobacteraceae bacterium]
MRITNAVTDDAVLVELGQRLTRLRLDRNLTQQQLADEAGVSRHTVLRLEDGHSVTAVALVRLLRALELLDGLELLVPQPLPSPIEQLEREGARRQRASGSRGEIGDEPSHPWRWGTP